MLDACLTQSESMARRVRGRSRHALGVAGWLLLVLATAGFWFSLGDHPLYVPDEGRYARSSQRMLETGNLIVPELDGHPRLQKPPLVYWLQSSCMAAMGETELAARLPSAASMTLTVGMVVLMGWAVRDWTLGVIAGVLVGIMPLSLACGRLAIIDPILTLFWTAAVFLGYFATRNAERGTRNGGEEINAKDAKNAKWEAEKGKGRKGGEGGFACLSSSSFSSSFSPSLLSCPWRPWCSPGPAFWLFWLAVSGAAFAKGPIGLLPGLVLWVWVVLRGRWRWGEAWRWGLGVAIAVGPLLAWVVLVMRNHPEAVALWWREVVKRAAGSGDHPQPMWYYVPVFAVGLFPATALLPVPGVHVSVRDLRRKWAEGSLGVYLAIATVVPLVVISLVKGKLMTYVLPLAPGVALGAALGLRDWLDVREEAERRRLPNGFGSIAVAATMAWAGLIGVAMGVGESHRWRAWLPTFDHEQLAVMLRLSEWLTITIALVWGGFGVWRRGGRGFRGWGMAVVAMGFVVAGYAAMEVAEDGLRMPHDAVTMLAEIHRRVPGPVRISTAGLSGDALSFYADQQVSDLMENPEAIDAATPRGQRWVLIVDPASWRKLERKHPEFARRFDRVEAWPVGHHDADLLIERPVERK